jgi:hypothetical protein
VNNPLGTPNPGATPNPFGDKPAAPFGPAPVNPYSSPSATASQGYFQPMHSPRVTRETVRPWLLGPAIGIIAVSVVGLGFMSMVGLGLAIDPNAIAQQAPPDAAGRAGFYGFFFFYFIFGSITRILQIVGAVSLIRVRGYYLAMAATICAMLPCDIYCCLGSLPFGIWGIIVLLRPDVRDAFQSP